MKQIYRILINLIPLLALAGCASTPDPIPISSDRILNWFFIGQTKLEVTEFFETLGYPSDHLNWEKVHNGEETLRFLIEFRKGGRLLEHVGTFELTFSDDGRLKSGRKISEENTNDS
jgi:hypothetical protein